MTINKLVAATALVALMAAPALAQGGRMQQTPEQREATFVAADANKDGKLDKAEMKNTIPEQFRAQIDDARLDGMFTRVDVNKDGSVSKDEFKNPPPMQRPQ